jgi:hypothetical protein
LLALEDADNVNRLKHRRKVVVGWRWKLKIVTVKAGEAGYPSTPKYTRLHDFSHFSLHLHSISSLTSPRNKKRDEVFHLFPLTASYFSIYFHTPSLSSSSPASYFSMLLATATPTPKYSLSHSLNGG